MSKKCPKKKALRKRFDVWKITTNLSCPARVGGPQVTHNLAAWVSVEGAAPVVDHNQVAKQVAAGESKAGWQAKTEISGRL